MKATVAKFDGDVVGEDVPADPRQHPQCVEVFEIVETGELDEFNNPVTSAVRVFSRPEGYVAPQPSRIYLAYRRAYWKVRAFLNRFVRAWRAF